MLLFSNLPHQKFLKINSSPSTDLGSNSKNSSFHQVVCLTNSFLAGLSPGSGKPQSPDQDVSNIKVESEVPWPIFEYPSDYGAKKYLLRKATAIANRSCHLYSQFSVSDISVHEIREDELIDRSSLTYMKGPENPNSASVPVTFGGNLDVNERKKYFNYSEGTELACGFANHGSLGFVVSEEDKKAMEQCMGLMVISAIFGAYDRIRQPMHVRRITAENIRQRDSPGGTDMLSRAILIRFSRPTIQSFQP
jgi:hypothetical protein